MGRKVCELLVGVDEEKCESEIDLNTFPHKHSFFPHLYPHFHTWLFSTFPQTYYYYYLTIYIFQCIKDSGYI